ncbi:Probable membrane protein Cj0124c [hydrothermal vent metagenome]|uniref:Probable membrane protein Cj0124c n=1 Tax=hydrothermal vent metagenome TaxID=652676 RepID=A0A3B1E6M9_9ZZZZ
MGLQKYSILSVLYILLVGGFAYYQNQDLFTIDILGYYTQSLHTALLIVLPIILFFILSLMHILMYGFRNYIKSRNEQKDIDKFFNSIEAFVLGKDTKEVFYNKNLQKIAKFLKYTTFKIDINKTYNTGIEQVDDALIAIKNVYGGEYVEKLEKTFNLEDTNELCIKNTFNKFSKNNKFYLEVLKNQEKYSLDIIEFAFLTAIDRENFSIIKKEIIDINISEQALIKIFKLYENEENELEEKDYLSIIKKANLSKEQYINLIKTIKTHIRPDKLITLMDKICDKDEKAIKSYIYLLLDLEMIDKAKELLKSVNAKDGEYNKFEVYLSVKDSGVKCNISDFI